MIRTSGIGSGVWLSLIRPTTLICVASLLLPWQNIIRLPHHSHRLLLPPCRLRQQILTSGIDNDVGLSLIQMLQDSRPVTGDNEEGVQEVGSCPLLPRQIR